MAVAAGSREPAPLAPVHCTPQALPSASASNCPSVHFRERGSPMKNRKREICTSGSVRDEDGQPPHLLGRRTFLHLAASAAALPAVSRIVRAQTHPTRLVRIVVGFTVGGFYDTYARLIAQWLSQHLGQPFVIENRTGAGGSIATEAVVRAAPDGYTLLFTGSNDAWNTALYDNLSFNYVRDIAPVASFSKGMGVLVVPPSFPARTVHEFIAYARDNAAKVTIASDGVGSGPHVFWELFRSMTGLNTLHVPYRGATPVIVDLLSSQVQAYFGYLAPLIENIRSGQLRPLAVTSAMRAEALPDVPTIAEFVPGYDATGWNGFGAPRNTSVEIIEKLNKAVNAGLADPRIKLRIAEFGDAVFASSPEEFGKHIVEFTDKWSKVIRAANIKQPELPTRRVRILRHFKKDWLK